MYYTIGQRKGIGIGNSKEGYRGTVVCDKNLETNELIVTQGDRSVLYSEDLLQQILILLIWKM